MVGDDPKNKDNTWESYDTAINHNYPYCINPSDSTKQLHVNDVLTDINYVDLS